MAPLGKVIGAAGRKFLNFVACEGFLLLDFLHPAILDPHEGVVSAPQRVGMETSVGGHASIRSTVLQPSLEAAIIPVACKVAVVDNGGKVLINRFKGLANGVDWPMLMRLNANDLSRGTVVIQHLRHRGAA